MKLLLSILAFLAFASTAHAQNAGAVSGSGSEANSGAAAVLETENTANVNAVGNQAQAGAEAGAASNSGAVAGGNELNLTLDQSQPGTFRSSSTSHQTYGTARIENTPDAWAPAVPGGNPCTVGASLGTSLPGFGISGGFAQEGKKCELRQQAALLHNMGFTNEAVAILCGNDSRFYEAFAATGKCSGGAAAPAPTAKGSKATRSPTEVVCYVKPGTKRTVVTNMQDKMACARSLGLTG